jgi:hypothetical protein
MMMMMMMMMLYVSVCVCVKVRERERPGRTPRRPSISSSSSSPNEPARPCPNRPIPSGPVRARPVLSRPSPAWPFLPVHGPYGVYGCGGTGLGQERERERGTRAGRSKWATMAGIRRAAARGKCTERRSTSLVNPDHDPYFTYQWATMGGMSAVRGAASACSRGRPGRASEGV